jgi:hypothetical protein
MNPISDAAVMLLVFPKKMTYFPSAKPVICGPTVARSVNDVEAVVWTVSRRALAAVNWVNPNTCEIGISRFACSMYDNKYEKNDDGIRFGDENNLCNKPSS